MENTSSTERLVRALFDKDVDGARRAVFAGADVDADANDNPSVPIWLDHVRLHDHDTASHSTYNEIWPQIIRRTKRMLEPDRYNSSLMFADEAWRLRNRDAATLMILKAIRQGEQQRKPFAIDFDANFAGLGDGKNPHHPARARRRAAMLAIHGLVRGKLNAPPTPFEEQVKQSMGLFARHLWLRPLKFPDLATLRQPSPELIVALAAMVQAQKDAARYRREEDISAVRLALGSRLVPPSVGNRLSSMRNLLQI